MTITAANDRIPLATLNAMSRAEFAQALGGVLEHSPHFAERAWAARPFATVEDVRSALVAEVAAAPEAEKLALLRAHPDLADRLTRLTTASVEEQASAGLDRLSEAEFAEFQALNAAYRERFDFPFIICARLNSKQTILPAFRSRLGNDRSVEFQTALDEVGKIARLRLADLLMTG